MDEKIVNLYYEKLKPDSVRKIIISLIIITLSYGIADYMYDLMEKRKHVRIIYGQLSIAVYYALLVLGFMFSLDNLGISQTTIMAILGTVGLTLALSLQTLFTGIIAGIYVGFKNLFRIGDYLEVTDTAGRQHKGRVVSVDLFSTIITAEEGIEEVIPNANIGNGIIKIRTKNKKRLREAEEILFVK